MSQKKYKKISIRQESLLFLSNTKRDFMKWFMRFFWLMIILLLLLGYLIKKAPELLAKIFDIIGY